METTHGRPLLLDLFCGAGGAAMGYHRAGFTVVGVDIKPQPRYPFLFIQADALEYARGSWFLYDAVHASPPCQAYSKARTIHKRTYPELIEPTREVCSTLFPWYVMENVPGAPLQEPVVLCGAMFGLKVIRHRLFESNRLLRAPDHPQSHGRVYAGRQNFQGRDGYVTVAGHNFQVGLGRQAMGIPWMTRDELAQAIPPAYTEYIGRQLIYPQSIHTPPPRSQSCR